jgi:hypothetical protein
MRATEGARAARLFVFRLFDYFRPTRAFTVAGAR